MTACTGNGASSAKCGCMYAWFEKHRSFKQFADDDAQARKGKVPPDLYTAAAACKTTK